MVTEDFPVVSTGARSAEWRDLLSATSGLSLRRGLSARPGACPEAIRGGPWSRRREPSDGRASTPPSCPGVKQRLEVRRTRIAKLERGDALSVRLSVEKPHHTNLEVIEGWARPIRCRSSCSSGGAGGWSRQVGEDVQHAVGRRATTSSARGTRIAVIATKKNATGPILCEPFTFNQPRGHLLNGRSAAGPARRGRGTSQRCRRCIASTVPCRRMRSTRWCPKSGRDRGARRRLSIRDKTCLTGCGVMTALARRMGLAPVEAGASVAVIGCGAVG